MKAIAQRSPDIFLVETMPEHAVLVNLEIDYVSKEADPDSFQKFGYFKDVTDEVAAERAVALVREKLGR